MAQKYKKDVVEKLVRLFKEYPIVGTVNMEDLPAPALQKMRAKLRGKADLFMTKRRLMKIAFEGVKDKIKGISELVGHLKGMPALLFTKENPFKIYKIIKQAKSPAPAKAGQTAPKDIEVKAGPTSFMPGPIIGELGSIGIKTSVEQGKIAIKEDTVVVKEGEEIGAKAAELLTRLGIEPMEVGLDITAVYENGVIYDRNLLDIDDDKFKSDMEHAALWARNLAVEIAFPTKDTTHILIAKAFRESKALALGADIMADAVAEELVAKAERQMHCLKNIADIGSFKDKPGKKPDAEPEKKEEQDKEQEKKEEPKEKNEENNAQAEKSAKE
ncbi:50S ribosomal protein L10 [Candidatus Woesearchaeota archaeon]|nr:50S ribosomal protein L10 [Candidatus Woesearchaeota archaeon]